MANEAHLEILGQGVGAWNHWRKANPGVVPDLGGVIFPNANLNNIDFSGTDLTCAFLRSVELNEANFRGANLFDADLCLAFLTNAKLEGAYLAKAQCSYTDFKCANLTGVCIEDWHINSRTNHNDVICNYVYLKGGLTKDYLKGWLTEGWSERRPHTGTFAPGEFAKLVQQSFDTIDLIFKEGLDWKAFAYSFKQVEVLYEDAHLEVRSIENKGDGVVIVKVAAAPNVDKGQIYTDFNRMYEFANKALSGYQQQLAIQSNHINQLLGIVSTSQEVQRVMAQNTGDTYNIGELKTAGFAPRGIASNNTFNDFSNTQDLAQAASQIQALLSQLQQQGQSPEAAQQQVADDLAAQAKQDPTLLGKLMMWGQKLGDATVTDVVKGVVKLALRSAGVPLP